MRRYVDWGIDVYGYVTFTTPSDVGICDDMNRFVDSLQGIHSNLPLRVIPLEIREFAPVANRLHDEHHTAMKNQQAAVRCMARRIASSIHGIRADVQHR